MGTYYSMYFVKYIEKKKQSTFPLNRSASRVRDFSQRAVSMNYLYSLLSTLSLYSLSLLKHNNDPGMGTLMCQIHCRLVLLIRMINICACIQ